MPSPRTSPIPSEPSQSSVPLATSPSGLMNRRNSRAMTITSPNPGSIGSTQQISTSQWHISRIPTMSPNQGLQESGTGNIHGSDINRNNSNRMIVDDINSTMLSPEQIFADMADRILQSGNNGGGFRRSIAVTGSNHHNSNSHNSSNHNGSSSNAPNGGRRRSRGQSTSVMGNDQLFTSFIMQMNGNNIPPGAQGFEAIAANIAAQQQSQPSQVRRPFNDGNGRITATNVSPLRHKLVYQLDCSFCHNPVCFRAMKAILLADTKIELFSTDIPPEALYLLPEDRMTQGCHCRIRDTVCRGCGNVLGYHVSQPCERCLDAKNNGHFWMFYSETVRAGERPDPITGKALYWGSLSPMRELDDHFNWIPKYEAYCR